MKSVLRPNHKSFFAYVCACKESLLLGGVKEHVSSRFADESQASDWLRTVITANCQAHRSVAYWGVSQSQQEPEI